MHDVFYLQVWCTILLVEMRPLKYYYLISQTECMIYLLSVWIKGILSYKCIHDYMLVILHCQIIEILYGPVEYFRTFRVPIPKVFCQRAHLLSNIQRYNTTKLYK
jgi:hypothetical protein